eukprot:gnl/TRDRNA2_/TRDRNA2_187868_c0_seq1.p1 gnl/TRDRNA2_/TRDRNA2_187868_c0~~gnl/TRDRNA2_/TRDRNA2_187868_c0_seq1.p1  ORF type:complete len:317 (-),score=47.76 gnl/TRDRNA2_/TRDRNA2_187868_c0_seq1:18-914(-)
MSVAAMDSLKLDRQVSPMEEIQPFERYSRRLLVTLAAGSIVVAGSSSWDVVGLTILCVAIYTGKSVALAKALPDAVVIVQGTKYPAWSFIAAFAHNLGTMLILLLLVLRCRLVGGKEGFTSWLYGPWHDMYDEEGSLLLADALDVLVFTFSMATELKDALMLDVKLTFMDMGFVAHHACVLVGALYCLQVPSSKGVVLLNAVNAYLGSASFNIPYTLKYMRPDWKNAQRFAEWFYWIGMTASNMLGLCLAAVFYYRTGKDMQQPHFYTTCTVALVVLRQIPVFQSVYEWQLLLQEKRR